MNRIKTLPQKKFPDYRLRLIKGFFQYPKYFGLSRGLRAFAEFFFSKKIIKIKIKDAKHPIYLRGATSDIRVFEQIFFCRDYDFPMDIKPKLIVDCGANIGLGSIYFSNRYPKAKIIAVEPEASNFKILQKNTINYKNIKAIIAGIWSENTYLNIRDIGIGKWGFVAEKTKKDTPGAVKALTIDRILKDSGLDKIDILKMDIEGSEIEVFSKNYDQWLGRVKIIIIELHDWIRPGCSKALFSAAEKYNFKVSRKRENFILIRDELSSIT